MLKSISDKTIERVRLFVLKSLSIHRYEHSMRVAKLSKDLCEHYGEDGRIGYFAGLCHDMCKEFDKKMLEVIAHKNKVILSETEKKKPSILHGKVCSIVLRKQFKIKNKEVLEAVEFHTFGKKNMCNIAKIVCVADKIEPERPYMSSLKTKNLLKLDLDILLFSVLKEVIEVRREKGEEVFPEALWIFE